MGLQKLLLILVWGGLLVQFSCVKNSEHLKNSTLKFSSSSIALEYFEKAKLAEEVSKKITHLNNAIVGIEDRKDTLLPILYNYKSFYHQQIKEYDSSLAAADSLYCVAQFQQDTSLMAQAYYRKSIVHRFQGNPLQEYKNAQDSYRLYKKINDSVNTAKRAIEMAIVQSDLTDFDGSQASATEVLKYSTTTIDSFNVSSAYNIIAISYKHQGLYQEAIEEYQNALKFSPYKMDSLSYYNNIALVHQEFKEYDKAIELFEYCLKNIDSSYVESHARYLANLAITKWKKDSTLNVEDDLLAAVELREKANDTKGLISSYADLSEYYEAKDKAKAIEFAHKYLEAAKDFGSKTSELAALQKLTRLAPSSFYKDISLKYMTLNDSLTTARLQSKNSFAKIKLDEENKIQQILTLENINTKQALTTQELRNRLIITILIILILCLGVFFLFYYLGQKHKREKIREVLRTENRISKLVHDELANDIYNVMSQMEKQAPIALTDSMERIYNRTRDISRGNSTIDTGENYLSNLLGLLANISPRYSKLIINGENNVKWEKLGKEKKMIIHRILQELIINTKKHSKANLIAIKFKPEGSRLFIYFTDNGVGCEQQSLNGGNGLQNMKDRITSINGTISFETAKNKGFKAIIQLTL